LGTVVPAAAAVVPIALLAAVVDIGAVAEGGVGFGKVAGGLGG